MSTWTQDREFVSDIQWRIENAVAERGEADGAVLLADIAEWVQDRARQETEALRRAHQAT